MEQSTKKLQQILKHFTKPANAHNNDFDSKLSASSSSLGKSQALDQHKGTKPVNFLWKSVECAKINGPFDNIGNHDEGKQPQYEIYLFNKVQFTCTLNKVEKCCAKRKGTVQKILKHAKETTSVQQVHLTTQNCINYLQNCTSL